MPQPRNWPDFTLSTAIPSPSGPIPIDNSPLSSAEIIAVKVYAYGGLVFFACIMLAAIVHYSHIIIYRRKFQDMPDDLEKDEDLVAATQNLPRRRVFTIQAYTSRPGYKRGLEIQRLKEEARARARAEIQLRKDKAKVRAREARLSADIQNAKRISWASSIATVKNEDGGYDLSPRLKRRNAFHSPDKPLKGILRNSASSFSTPQKSLTHRPTSSRRGSNRLSPNRPTSGNRLRPNSSTSRIASETTSLIAPVPKAYTEPRRTQTHMESRALNGQEMIGTTKPDDCERWAGPPCTCQEVEGPDSGIQAALCEVHRFS